MPNNYFLKLAELQNQRVFYTKNSRLNCIFIKIPNQKVYLVGKLEPVLVWWLVSSNGVSEFSDTEKALNAFFGVSGMKMSGFIRKSSYAKFDSADKVKVASILKKAICYDGDAWIENPEELINSSKQDLWAITSTGNHVARLFDEREFPLNV